MRALRLALPLFIVLASSNAIAQNSTPANPGVQPYQSYDSSGIDTINLSSGTSSIKIPLISYPQRGGELRLSFSVILNSRQFSPIKICTLDDGEESCFQSWTYSVDEGGAGSGITDDQAVTARLTPFYETHCGGCGPVQEGYSVVFVQPDQGVHAAGRDLNGQRAFDATGLYIGLPYVDPNDPTLANCTNNCAIIDPQGIEYPLATAASSNVLRQDGNGNQIWINGADYIDTVGRSIPDPSEAPTSSNTSGCTGPLPTISALIWQVPSAGGGTQPFTFCYASVAISIPALDDYRAYSTTVTDLQSIVLPNGETWTIYYGSKDPSDPSTVNYGDVSQITTPEGGTISYTYAREAAGTCSGIVLCLTSRTINAMDGNSPQVWTYDWDVSQPASPPGDTTNLVIDPLGNATAHAFPPAYYISWEVPLSEGLYEVQTTYFSGSAAQNQVVKTVTTAYQYQGAGDNTAGFPTTVTSTLNNGQTSEKALTYAAIDSSGFIGGQVTDEKDYDYGSGSPGSLLREIQTGYEFLSNSAYLNDNMIGLVASSTTYGGGSVEAATSYTYDESAYLTSSGISAQHASPSFAVRGNPTTTAAWVGSATLQSHTNWYDTGEPYQAIDTAGNTTTYSYSGTYAGSLPTQITNALGQTTNYTYDLSTGLVTGLQDPNDLAHGRVGTLYSYDALERLTLVDSEPGALDAGGASAESKTAYSYPTATQTNVAQDQVTTGDGALKGSRFYDGFGRRIRTIGPDGAVVETARDGLGRVCAQSNPTFNDPGALNCAASQNPAPVSGTDGITYFTYDPLSRPILQTQPDGTTLQWSYTGNAVDFYDEDQSHWQRTSDALGRLTKVLENDPAGSGALTLETDYGYDALADLTSVNQKGASGDTPVVRSFAYDGLSRLTSATNPEAGTTQYSYSGTGGGLCSGDSSKVCSKTDARGITTTYGYDALNRIAGESYANDPSNTPSLSFAYDTELPWQQVTNENNPIGHLSYVQATIGGAPVVTWANEDFDQRGKILGYYNCIGMSAQTCNSNYVTDPGNGASYYYNLNEALGSISLDSCTGACAADPAEYVAYTYDGGGRLTSITPWVGIYYPSQDGSGFTTTAWNSPTYNALGRVTNANVALNPQNQVPAYPLSRTFDNRGRTTGEIDGSIQAPVYYYSVSYDGNSNVIGFTDPMMGGTYSVLNDSLHRFSVATLLTGGAAGTYMSETYDHFGNREQEVLADVGWTPNMSTYMNFTAGNNRVDDWSYGASGNLLYDQTNYYRYDAEGRICAVEQAGGGMTQYLYSPDGTRLGKGTITSFSCDMTKNGFSLTNLYTLGPSGEPLQEIDGNSNLINDDVFWEGRLLATFSGTDYSLTNWQYAFNDWVGSNRLLTNYDGSNAVGFSAGPFGDIQGPIGVGSDPSGIHFTGKERDTESGNDYFGARYYSSSMARFLSPDWSAEQDPVPYAQLSTPQSLNLYSYVQNNPLSGTDPDGHLLTLQEEQESWGDLGSIGAVSAALAAQADTNIAQLVAQVEQPDQQRSGS